MKNIFSKDKIIYIAGAVILLIAIIVALIFVFKKDEAPKQSITKTFKVEDVVIDNITISENGGLYVLSARVKNDTKKDVTLKNIVITLYDAKGNETTMKGYVGSVKAGKESKLVVNIDQDITNTKDIKIEVEK